MDGRAAPRGWCPTVVVPAALRWWCLLPYGGGACCPTVVVLAALRWWCPQPYGGGGTVW